MQSIYAVASKLNCGSLIMINPSNCLIAYKESKHLTKLTTFTFNTKSHNNITFLIILYNHTNNKKWLIACI